jgi:DNA-binding GntR family transcriptional regulator
VTTGEPDQLTGRRSGQPLYLKISEHLREQLAQVEAGKKRRLPTESDLTRDFGVSRHTARRAYAELVSQGLVERTPGKGTFPVPSRRFLMSVGSVDDLLAQPADREVHVVRPLTSVRDETAATKLGLPTDDVAFVAYQLVHRDRPFALTRIYLPLHIAEVLVDIPFLRRKGAVSKDTVISLLDRKLHHPIAMAKQLITAVAAPADVAEAIDCEPGQPLLKIEYLYFDTDARPVQLTVNFYNPEQYEYRAQLPGHRVPAYEQRHSG